MSKKENKILDPFTAIVVESGYYSTSKSIVNHTTGSITKDDGCGFMKEIYDHIMNGASYKKFKFNFTEGEFQDMCERVWIAHVDKLHEVRNNSYYDVLKPNKLLISFSRDCDYIDIELQSDGRHYDHSSLVSISTQCIKFNFMKPYFIKGKEVVSTIYPSYTDDREDK